MKFTLLICKIFSGGVAVLACNATAATYWAKDEWKLNQNPASTVYRVLWSFCEPVLFAYTGTFFIVSLIILDLHIKLINKDTNHKYTIILIICALKIINNFTI